MRIKAFTIIELLVSLLISGILLGFCWQAYFFLRNYRKQLEDKSTHQIDAKRIEWLISRDFAHAGAYGMLNDALWIKTPADSVVYQWDMQAVVRTNTAGSADTLARGLAFSAEISGIKLTVCVGSSGIPACFQLKAQPSSVDLLKAKHEVH